MNSSFIFTRAEKKETEMWNHSLLEFKLHPSQMGIFSGPSSGHIYPSLPRDYLAPTSLSVPLPWLLPLLPCSQHCPLTMEAFPPSQCHILLHNWLSFPIIIASSPAPQTVNTSLVPCCLTQSLALSLVKNRCSKYSVLKQMNKWITILPLISSYHIPWASFLVHNESTCSQGLLWRLKFFKYL